jgi:hypothetical protein
MAGYCRDATGKGICGLNRGFEPAASRSLNLSAICRGGLPLKFVTSCDGHRG